MCLYVEALNHASWCKLSTFLSAKLAFECFIDCSTVKWENSKKFNGIQRGSYPEENGSILSGKQEDFAYRMVYFVCDEMVRLTHRANERACRSFHFFKSNTLFIGRQYRRFRIKFTFSDTKLLGPAFNKLIWGFAKWHWRPRKFCCYAVHNKKEWTYWQLLQF